MRSDAHRTTVWFGFARLIPIGSGKLRLRLRWGRIAVACLLLCLGAYLAGALGLYYLFKEHRGFSEIRYTDILFLQRTELRQRQGEADIASAQAALERGAPREAFNYLRTGVGRAPGNLEGRQLLIQFYANSHPQLAEELFRRGLIYHADNQSYRVQFAQFLIHLRKDAEARALIEDSLSRKSSDASANIQLATLGMRLAHQRGAFAEAYDFYHTYFLNRTEAGILEAVASLTRMDRLDEAISLLEAAVLSPEFRHHLSMYQKLIELYLKAERITAASDLALHLSLQAPLEWQPRLLLLRIWQESGQDPEPIGREARALVEQFGTNSAALTALAHFARDYGLMDIAMPLYTHALEQGQDASTFALILLETSLRAGDHAQALRLCTEFEVESPDWLESHLAAFYSIRTLAAYASGNRQLGSLYQRELLREARRRPQLIHLVALAFRQAELPDIALLLFEHAHELAPEDEGILANLIELQLQLRESNQLSERVRRLLDLRRPDYAVFHSIQKELHRERSLFRRDTESLTPIIESVLAELKQAPGDWQLGAPL